MSTVFKSVNTLREKLVNEKDRTPKEKKYNLVYCMKCAHPGCDESFIWETKQALKQRLNLHLKPRSSEISTNDSAVYTHTERPVDITPFP